MTTSQFPNVRWSVAEGIALSSSDTCRSVGIVSRNSTGDNMWGQSYVLNLPSVPPPRNDTVILVDTDGRVKWGPVPLNAEFADWVKTLDKDMDKIKEDLAILHEQAGTGTHHEERLRRLEGLMVDQTFPYGMWVRPNFLFNDGWLMARQINNLTHGVVQDRPDFPMYTYDKRDGRLGHTLIMTQFDESKRLLISDPITYDKGCFAFDHEGIYGTPDPDPHHDNMWYWENDEADLGRHMVMFPYNVDQYNPDTGGVDPDNRYPTHAGFSRLHCFLTYDLVMGTVKKGDPLYPYMDQVLNTAEQGNFNINQVIASQAEFMAGDPLINNDLIGQEKRWALHHTDEPPVKDSTQKVVDWIKQRIDFIITSYIGIEEGWGRFSSETWTGQFTQRCGCVQIEMSVTLEVPKLFWWYTYEVNELEGAVLVIRKGNVPAENSAFRWPHPKMTIKYRVISRVLRINYDETQSPDKWVDFLDVYEPFGSAIGQYLYTVKNHMGFAPPTNMTDYDVWVMVRPRQINFFPVLKDAIIKEWFVPKPLDIINAVFQVLGFLPEIGPIFSLIGQGIDAGSQILGQKLASSIGSLGRRVQRAAELGDSYMFRDTMVDNYLSPASWEWVKKMDPRKLAPSFSLPRLKTKIV